MLIHFEDVYNREDAEALRNQWLFVAEEDAMGLEEGIYYVHDLIGLTVLTTEGETLGTITDVLFTGANEVYVVRPVATSETQQGYSDTGDCRCGADGRSRRGCAHRRGAGRIA